MSDDCWSITKTLFLLICRRRRMMWRIQQLRWMTTFPWWHTSAVVSVFIYTITMPYRERRVCVDINQVSCDLMTRIRMEKIFWTGWPVSRTLRMCWCSQCLYVVPTWRFPITSMFSRSFYSLFGIRWAQTHVHVLLFSFQVQSEIDPRKSEKRER